MFFEFKFPDVGEGVHEGKVLQLTKSPGDLVSEGDIIAIVETDKVVAEIPTSKSGKLIKYSIDEGQIIEVGKTLAFIDEGAQGTSTTNAATFEKPQEDKSTAVVGELESAGNFVLPASGEGIVDRTSEAITLSGIPSKVLATPLARKIASTNKIDISKIKGTGPAGRVTREDVLKQVNLKTFPKESEISTPKHQPLQQDITEQLPTIRRTIASNMQRSSEIPTASFHEQCILDETVKLRKIINQTSQEKISYLPIYIKALSVALKAFEVFNATFDAQKMELRKYKNINIGIAVDTEKGLMVPVIKNVENKNIKEIDREMKQLIAKARNGSITLAEMREGTFSITNYGSFGGLYGNPLILPPQVGILGIGRIHDAPIVKNGIIIPATIQPISLVFDHRVVDGAPASNFITYFKSLLEDPYKLLVELN